MLQWFPGHMKKALRQLDEISQVVDLFVVVLDSRIPLSSFNFEFEKIAPRKPRLFVITKKDLADLKRLDQLQNELKKHYTNMLIVNLKSSADVKKIELAIPKLAVFKSASLRRARVAVVGIPNSGKSTLINALAKKRRTKVGNRPGVTRGQQWVALDEFQLLDTPGILWPKFEDETVAVKLALVGSIRYDIIDKEAFVIKAIQILLERYPERTLPILINSKKDLTGDYFERLALHKGFLQKGGLPDTSKAINFIVNYLRDMEGVTLD